RVSRVKIDGKRVALQGRRSHGNISNVIANWPAARQVEMRLPFVACMTGERIDYQAGERVFHCTAGDFLLVPSRVPHPGGPLREPVTQDQVLDVLAFSTWDNHRQCCLCHAMGGNYLVSNPTTVLLLDALMEEVMARRPGYERAAANM